MIRVVLADDQTLIRQGIQTLLELEDDIVVVGTAADGLQAIRVVNTHRPDVVLMDVRMPNLDGVAATREILAQHPQIGILILTTFDDDDAMFAGLKAGARGYMLKNISSDEMAAAIRRVAAGDTLIQPSLTRKVVAELNRLAAPPPQLDNPLTDREHAVLRCLADGLSNREIADKLVITEGTVKNHVSNILNKLDVRDRTQAILRGQTLKLI